MLKIAIAYGATALVFLLLDGGFLSLVGPKLYKPELGPLIADKVKLAPAVLFYLLYVAGMVYFCVAPNLDGGWTKALVAGAILGLVAYGTYDLTCAAVLSRWSLKVTVVDMIWGTVASGTASAVAVLATRFLTRSMGA